MKFHQSLRYVLAGLLPFVAAALAYGLQQWTGISAMLTLLIGQIVWLCWLCRDMLKVWRRADDAAKLEKQRLAAKLALAEAQLSPASDRNQ